MPCYKKLDGRLDLGILHCMSISRNLVRSLCTDKAIFTKLYVVFTEHFYHKKGKVAILKEYANRAQYTPHSYTYSHAYLYTAVL